MGRMAPAMCARALGKARQERDSSCACVCKTLPIGKPFLLTAWSTAHKIPTTFVPRLRVWGWPLF